MDRTGKIAVAVAVITLFVWTFFNQRQMEKVAATRRAAAAAEEQQKAAEQPPKVETPAAPPGRAEPAKPAAAEKRETLSGPSVEATFTNLGGGIAREVLLKHNADLGRNVVLNEFGTIPIGAISELAGEAAHEPFTASVDEPNGAITFERTDARQLQTTKRFAIPKSTDPAEDYVIPLDVTFTNRGAQTITIPSWFVHTGPAAPVHQRDLPYYTGFKWSDGKLIDITWFAGGWFRAARPTFTASREKIAWAAVAD